VTIVPDFVSSGINMTVAVSDGMVGNVNVVLTQGQGFVSFEISSIIVNGTSAPTSYVNIINRDLPDILTTALDSILNARFGGTTNVHTLTITSDAIIVTLNSQ
jgi:hypothetical protein